MTEQLDAETEEISGELGNFHIIADGVEKEIKVKSVGELFRKIGYIFEDSGTLFLEDSKQDGRRLDFAFGDEDVLVRELTGEDLVVEVNLGEDGGYGRILEIPQNELANTPEADDECST